MPKTPTLYGPYGVAVWGEYQYTAQEADPGPAQALLFALYDAWPVPAFWQAIPRVVIWSGLRPDRPPAFGQVPAAASLYFPGDRHIALNANLCVGGEATLAYLAHELGHHLQHHYTERIASDVGALLLHRLGRGPAPGAIEVYAAEVQANV